jgi:hypothetical protein
MGEMLPEYIPGEPKWLQPARIVLAALVGIALVFGASSYFVWVMGR